MEKACVGDELAILDVTTECKRQKICEQLEKSRADTSQLLKNLYDHLDVVVKKKYQEVKLQEDEIRILTLKLGDIEKKIEEQTGKLEAKAEEVKAKEIESGNRERQVQLLRKQIKLEEEKLIELRRSVRNAQNELELKNKELRQSSSVLVKHEQQPIAVKKELVNAHENSLASSSRGLLNPSSVPRAIRDRPEYVLSLVERELRNADQREESGLHDSVVKDLIPLLQELPEIAGVSLQLRSKATEVANVWKGKIRIEAPKSSLEAFAFLLFIVAYGLKSLINKEETALLATSVFHYEQGPDLFDKLGFGRKIPDIVRGFIKDRQYIPAVRIICLFNLKDFSVDTLLMVEISELRRSATEKAERKDVGKLRAIVELVEDYKLDIDIPGDLIAKLLLRRENPTRPVLHCSVKTTNEICTSSSNPQATLSNGHLLVPKREVKPFARPSANGRQGKM